MRHHSSLDTGPAKARNAPLVVPVPRCFQLRGSRFVTLSAPNVKASPIHCAAVVATAAAAIASGMPGILPAWAMGHNTLSPTQLAKPANSIVYNGVFESFFAKWAAPQTAET